MNAHWRANEIEAFIYEYDGSFFSNFSFINQFKTFSNLNKVLPFVIPHQVLSQKEPKNLNTGFIEFVKGTVLMELNSDDIHKKVFERGKKSFKRFFASFVGSTIASYLFSIHDRHHNNILLTECGSICHIDFCNTFGTLPWTGLSVIF